MSLLAPVTFSITYMPPQLSSAALVCAIIGGSLGAPRMRLVECALHGGDAMVTNERARRRIDRISSGLLESPWLKHSRPKRRQ